MPSHQRAQLSLGEKLQLFGTIGAILIRIFLSVFRILPLLWTAEWSFKRVLAAAMTRNLDYLSIRQRRYLFAASGETIRAFCLEQQLECSCTVVNCADNPPATLHEIRLNPSNEAGGKVLVYFPGGGYVNALVGTGQLGFATKCARTANAQSIICLESSLAPELKYPSQLAQASAALQYLLDERQIKPKDIVLFGDSAGGNLALSLLAHIIAPKDGIPRLDSFSRAKGDRFNALALINPWVSLSHSAKSFHENAYRDMITPESVQLFVENWQPAHEVWAEPILGTRDFWKLLPVQKTIVTAGTFETFREDILQFQTILSDSIEDCTVVKGENEIHGQSAIDYAMALPPSGSTAAVLAWLETL